VVQTFTLLSVEVCFQQEYLRPTVYFQEIAKFLEWPFKNRRRHRGDLDFFCSSPTGGIGPALSGGGPTRGEAESGLTDERRRLHSAK
jgi:hypothetical protein